MISSYFCFSSLLGPLCLSHSAQPLVVNPWFMEALFEGTWLTSMWYLTHFKQPADAAQSSSYVGVLRGGLIFLQWGAASQRSRFGDCWCACWKTPAACNGKPTSYAKVSMSIHIYSVNTWRCPSNNVAIKEIAQCTNVTYSHLNSVTGFDPKTKHFLKCFIFSQPMVLSQRELDLWGLQIYFFSIFGWDFKCFFGPRFSALKRT